MQRRNLVVKVLTFLVESAPRPLRNVFRDFDGNVVITSDKVPGQLKQIQGTACVSVCRHNDELERTILD